MKQILIVEDNKELQDLYKDQLDKKGYKDVIFADTTQKGLAILMDTKPDLVILDIMLPAGANGFDMLESMKQDQRTAEIPVMIITNLDDQEKSAREIGVVDYIVKSNTPFEQIIEKVAKFLG